MTKKTRQHRKIDYTLGFCFLCNGLKDFDHEGKRQVLLTCFDCHRNVHAACYQLDPQSIQVVQTYDWQCNDCKSCSTCSSKQNESKIVICNQCDRGYHTFCCDPPLKNIPKDDWYCSQCSTQPTPLSSIPDNQPKPSKQNIPKPSTPVRVKKGEEENQPMKLRLTVKKKRGRPKSNGNREDKEDELFFKTFGHKLTKAESSTKRGAPTDIDILYFEKARLKAEHSHMEQQKRGMELDVPKISRILFNGYFIDTWYVAPYPEEYSQNSTLYICEFCMKYMKSSYIAGRHRLKCQSRHPPGDEIYRHGNISVFEVDGRKHKMYCQNLCLMAKMFLDHKTLYYDVEPFLFYIMTETDDTGCHFVGYFSKEKRSAMNYNVSCILTIPIYQRKGYGQFLIDFSYLLSKKENNVGSPERPLSDLGLISYRSYWKNTLFRQLLQAKESISIEELSHITSMTPDDIVSTLEFNNMIRQDESTKTYSITIDSLHIQCHLEKLDEKGYVRVDPEKLTWTPFILSRDRLAPLINQQQDNDE